MIGYSSNHILSDRINRSILSKYSRERKRKEEKGEYVQNTSIFEEYLQRFANSRKNAQSRCEDKSFPRAAFSSSLSPLEPRLPQFRHGEIRDRRKMSATVTRHFLRSKGGIILSNEGISDIEIFHRLDPPIFLVIAHHGSRIRYRFIVFIVNPCLAY